MADRIDSPKTACGKEENIPARLFAVLEERRNGLMALRDEYGPVVKPTMLK